MTSDDVAPKPEPKRRKRRLIPGVGPEKPPKKVKPKREIVAADLDPSKPLKNKKWEAFIQAMIADPIKLPADCYMMIYGTSSKTSAFAASSRLLKNGIVSNRLSWLQAQTASSAIMSGQEVLEELSKLARSNMKNYMKPDEDGTPTLDFANLTDDQTAALAEVTVEEFVQGRSEVAEGGSKKRELRRTKFKLHDKRGALELLAKHHQLFIERHEHKHEHEHTVIGNLMREIDEASRDILTIEHRKDETKEG